MKHWTVAGTSKPAEVPAQGSVPGHLPKVIKRLVQRRRAVKDLLKNERSPAKRSELDIRQKALKLVANSSVYHTLGAICSAAEERSSKCVCSQSGRSLSALCLSPCPCFPLNSMYGCLGFVGSRFCQCQRSGAVFLRAEPPLLASLC